MSFRKEFKFRLSKYELLQAKSMLIKDGMKLLHPQRQINSLYFDSPSFKMFSESEEGTLPRKKVRVRWYNDNNVKYQLEVKTSSNEGRFKTAKIITSEELKHFKDRGIIDAFYGKLVPSIIVSYNREYFEYQGLRVTFDSNITYKSIDIKTSINESERVMEIKTSIDTPNDFVERIFPYSTSRFSKYSRGIILLMKL